MFLISKKKKKKSIFFLFLCSLAILLLLLLFLIILLLLVIPQALYFQHLVPLHYFYFLFLLLYYLHNIDLSFFKQLLLIASIIELKNQLCFQQFSLGHRDWKDKSYRKIGTRCIINFISFEQSLRI